MADLTGDPKIDALLIKHADEIERMEAFAKEKAAEIDRMIAAFHQSRAKRMGTVGVQ